MPNRRFMQSEYFKRLIPMLAFALAAWGGQACAHDDGMRQIAGMQGMNGMSADMHAHHHQMMQRQGYARSVHEYVAPDLALVDMNGESTSLKDLLDTREPVMMNFIFTTCTTICPVLTATFSQVRQELGAESEKVRMISITIDPEQDTPQRLKRYAQRYGAGSRWRFLTGERDRIVSVEKAFDIYRGSKSNHEPITLLRGAGGGTWVRLEGIASASDIIGEYRKLDAAGK